MYNDYLTKFLYPRRYFLLALFLSSVISWFASAHKRCRYCSGVHIRTYTALYVCMYCASVMFSYLGICSQTSIKGHLSNTTTSFNRTPLLCSFDMPCVDICTFKPFKIRTSQYTGQCTMIPMVSLLGRLHCILVAL